MEKFTDEYISNLANDTFDKICNLIDLQVNKFMNPEGIPTIVLKKYIFSVLLSLCNSFLQTYQKTSGEDLTDLFVTFSSSLSKRLDKNIRITKVINLTGYHE